MPVTIRSVRRPDRDQLTELVNRHVATVLPGVALSTNVVLGQLEREPGERLVDPWVAERHCLVAIEADAVVAATLVHRFRRDADVGEGYRGAADVRWFVADPQADDAGRELLAHAIALAKSWKPSHLHAEQSLPAPGCLGISDSWPHVRRLFIDAGFNGPTRSEMALAIRCRDLETPIDPAMTVMRSVGRLGARLDLIVAGSSIGYIEVGDISTALARSAAGAHWTDVGNLFATDPTELPTVMPALLSAAAAWLRLGGIDRLIDYFAPDVHPPDYLATLHKLGFTTLSRNERGWELPLGPS